jgi:hypothetical protein
MKNASRRKNLKNYLLMCLFFLAAQLSVFPQNQSGGELQPLAVEVSADAENEFDEAPAADDRSDAQFVISSITFNVKGHTRVDALMYNGEFKEGERLTGRENLEKYIQNKKQLLTNQRVLKDTVKIEYTIGEPYEDGSFPVSLQVSVEDTWNIIALPKPEYSSNTGFDLTIKARDYNFLGTMNPLRIDLGYAYDENDKSSFKFEIDSDTPFKAWGFNWNVNFDHFFHYRPDVSEPFYYRNVTGLSMELPVKRTTITFGFEESITVNDENSDTYKDLGWPDFQTGPFMATALRTSWKIPLGLEVFDYGELTYTPGVTVSIPHGFSKWPLAEFRKGPSMAFSHSLSFERIDWVHNYRQGAGAALGNSYSYNFHKLDQGADALSISFTVRGTGHFIITAFFAISTRLQYRHFFYHEPNYYGDAGDVLRGILDKAVRADYMLSLNLDFPFRVLEFLPSKWFNNSKLRLFDFELQLSPIIDIALRHDPSRDIAFTPQNILVTGGGELIVFPAFFRSLYLRVSFGVNLVEFVKEPSKIPGGDNREIFIGIGHFF